MGEPVEYGTLCEMHGKTGYKTRARAQAALEHVRDQGKTERVPRRVYRDPACRMWHMTSKNGGYQKP
jgi:hypothetical protein